MSSSAICFSGLARQIEQSYPNIKRNLIDPNGSDVFIHAWVPEEDVALRDQILTLYQPKDWLFEPQKKFYNHTLNMDRMMNSYAKPYQRDSFVETFYSCWYSAQQSSLVKERYRLERNIQYHYTVRARFDINYDQPVSLKSYDPNILHLSCRELPPEMIDDRFAFASDRIMNATYGNVFGLIDLAHNWRDQKEGDFCGEALLWEVCQAFKIPTRKLSLHCSHVR